MSKTVVITSGYFNPIHPGHIECFNLAKKLGDELWVILNTDFQAELKRGVPSFQDENFRMKIVEAIKPVDKVILSIDKDASVCESLKMIFEELRNNPEVGDIIFAKGGDRFSGEVPEKTLCHEYGVKIVDGLGSKTHNSSDYIKKTI